MSWGVVSQTILNSMDTVVSRAVVKKVLPLDDKSSVYCLVNLIPESTDTEPRQINAVLTYPICSTGTRINYLPKVGDLVLVVMSPDTNEAFVVGSIPNVDEVFNQNITAGTLTIEAKKIELGTNPTSPAVLGDVMCSYITDLQSLLKDILDFLKQGNYLLTTVPNAPTAPAPTLPVQITQFEQQLVQLKSKYVDTSSSNINSAQTFIARGGS